MDVNYVFLNGTVEEIYVEYPLGYEVKQENKVYKLRKVLYGLNRLQKHDIQELSRSS